MKVTDREYALELDKNDPSAHFKSRFVITDPEMCYLDGNSLGRLPKSTITAITDFMNKEWGPEGSYWLEPLG
jgi:kynureninase